MTKTGELDHRQDPGPALDKLRKHLDELKLLVTVDHLYDDLVPNVAAITTAGGPGLLNG